MHIKSLEYRDSKWELSELQLLDINLIVGKNAVGKSKTLGTISLLVQLLSQKRSLAWGGRWEIEFVMESGESLRFEFATKMEGESGIVVHERMFLGERRVVYRTHDGTLQVWNATTSRVDSYTPPENKLAVHLYRDVRQYPYLEELALWAESSYGIKFGNINPDNPIDYEGYSLLTPLDRIPFLFQRLPQPSRERVMQSLVQLGFNVENVLFQERGNLSFLKLTETGLQASVPQYHLSQGLYRSLFLCIYLEYVASRRKTHTLIIDDLAEGLDYQRATKLANLVIDKCQEAGIQLVASSNDSFLMDVVDISHWNLLYRQGKSVKSINERNNPDLFRRFRFTGLSNFDFLSSDFLQQHQVVK